MPEAPVRIDYDRRLWKGYARGRALPRHAIAVWLDAVSRHAGSARPLTVLDLGSGTGRFSPSLAEWFGGPVYGVEPAANMRQVAVTTNAHPSVSYLAGRAEAIPLPDASCDLAFLFFVIHHFEDVAVAAAELRRVLKSRGLVCIRSQFSDRLRDVSWRRYFPRALEIERKMFSTVDETVEAFRPAGFCARRS